MCSGVGSINSFMFIDKLSEILDWEQLHAMECKYLDEYISGTNFLPQILQI